MGLCISKNGNEIKRIKKKVIRENIKNNIRVKFEEQQKIKQLYSEYYHITPGI
jgi:hypothetical protein